MYDLTLDSGTRALWRLGLYVTLVVLCVSLLFLLWAAIARRRRLALAAGLIGVLAVLAMASLTPSPYTFVRHRIEPSIRAGEEVYRRYADYHQQHGRYPTSVEEIYLPELDRFDIIEGVRRDTEKCDGSGGSCQVLRVSTFPLRIHIDAGMIRCEITNLERDWRCHDMF